MEDDRTFPMHRRRSRTRILWPWVIGLLIFLGIGCEENAEIRRDQGFQTRIHTDPESGSKTRYVLFVPRRQDPQEKPPVILFLNGQGENGEDGLRQISNNFGVDIWRKREQFPFLAVCPQCSPQGSWDSNGPDSRRALAILDEVIREFDADLDRVYLTGVSLGGSGVWSMGAAHAERFAVLVPISAVGSEGAMRVAAESRLPIWGFYNGRDNREVVKSGRDARRILIEAGLSPLMTEFDQLGHNAWHAYDNPFLYEWLLEQRRSKNAERPRYTVWSPQETIQAWDAAGSGEWTVANKTEVRGRIQAQGQESVLTCPQSLAEGEVHVDLFLEEGMAGRLRLTSLKTGEVCDFVLTLTSSGFGGLKVGNAPLVPFDPIAQRALDRGWNDIRIFLTGGELSVSLNGWPALQGPIPFGDDHVTWSLVAGSSGNGSRWRYPRMIRSAPLSQSSEMR